MELCWMSATLKKIGSWNISTPPRKGRKLVVGIWFGGSQAAVGPARGSQFPQNILSTWFETIFYLFFGVV